MNDSELYNRVIHVEVAKPHRGLAGLDTTLPGIPPPFSLFFLCCFVDVLFGVVIGTSVATGGMDQGECESGWW
jgi:hypothetical protein